MEAKRFLTLWASLCEREQYCVDCVLREYCGQGEFFVPYNEHDIDKMIDIVQEWRNAQLKCKGNNCGTCKFGRLSLKSYPCNKCIAYSNCDNHCDKCKWEAKE